MRYKVETRYGYVSYDESDREKAFALYVAEGVRLLHCRDIFDDGVVFASKAVAA